MSLIAAALDAFIAVGDYPCLGAKAALARGGIEVLDGGDFADCAHDEAIVAALQRFAGHVGDDRLFVSFAVAFVAAPALSEQDFEQALWRRLQALHEIDQRRFGWDPAVSSDPHSAHFSMSIGGRAFYVIGLHPASSRPARRFRQPLLVFNLHSQFERLRADGRYAKLRQAIVQRDVAHAGSANPMLAVHGTSPEARQYSGRRVGADWVCPFRAMGRGECR
ncbi:guanitoxin biosynthesis heme-dependent pre-guanitoxin N-hydroxylase GntA [Rhodanobacter umsongensis]|uniref:Guanitoxin biosynthesis heme-dependent pre-guanitoxin N-hydroxylase GntA n=1 Tax=Rhodanobacter umsongensis TaxID=633153 RepID=A0ABW0JK46_9GAMM